MDSVDGSFRVDVELFPAVSVVLLVDFDSRAILLINEAKVRFSGWF